MLLSYNWTPGHLSQKNEKLSSHKNLYMNVYISFICNSPKLETALMFFDRQMVKQFVVHPYHRKLLSNKKEQTDTYNNLDEALENYSE